MQDQKKQEQIAVFRYALIAPTLHMSSKERNSYFNGLVGKELNVPHYGLKKYKKATFEGWLYKYRVNGLESLKALIRRDKGVSRKISKKVIAFIKEIIADFPKLGASGIYQKLLNQGHVRPGDFSENSLRTYIRKHNLRKPAETKGRKKFEKANVNDSWVSDAMHGPYIKSGRRRRKTYLLAIIDDNSRLIVGSGFFFHENTSALAIILKRAIAVYGIPKIFYCDNGSIFSTHYLQLIAGKIGFALVHSQPYDSPSRGKIERFFGTVRTKFLAALKTEDLTLEELNKCFKQWLEIEYTKHYHYGIKTRPLDKYLENASKIKIKTLSDHELEHKFLNVITRKVKNDATISIDKKYYETPIEYIGKKIELCFPVDQPGKISIMKAGKPILQLREVNLIENANKPYTGIHFKNLTSEEKKQND